MQVFFPRIFRASFFESRHNRPFSTAKNIEGVFRFCVCGKFVEAFHGCLKFELAKIADYKACHDNWLFQEWAPDCFFLFLIDIWKLFSTAFQFSFENKNSV